MAWTYQCSNGKNISTKIKDKNQLIWQIKITKNSRLQNTQEPFLVGEGVIQGSWNAINGEIWPHLLGKRVRLNFYGDSLSWLPSEQLLSGQVLRLRGKWSRPKGFHNPGARDPSLFFNRKKWVGKIQIPHGPILVFPNSPKFSAKIWSQLDGIRHDIKEKIYSTLSLPNASLACALLLGLRSQLPEEIKRNFTKSGLAHVLAVSGLHIGIFSVFCFYGLVVFFKRFRFLQRMISPRSLALVIHAPLLGFYLILCGVSPSAQRATEMILLVLLAKVFFRKIHLFNLFGLVALGSMVRDPSLPWNLSWQLSFSAVFMIIVGLYSLKPLVFSKGSNFFNYFRGLFWVTLWASLGTLPFVAYHFGQIPTLGLLTNFLLIPVLTFYILPLLFISLFSYFFSYLPVFGSWFAVLCEILWVSVAFVFEVLHWVLGFLSHLSFSVIHVPELQKWQVGLYLLPLGGLLLHKRLKKFILIGVPIILLVVGHTAFYQIKKWKGKNDFWIEFLDVGHGDAATVHLPGGKILLVDGGGQAHHALDLGKRVWLPYFRSRGIKKIDFLLVTHPHPDHFKGFQTLLEEIPIGHFWYNGDLKGGLEWKRFLKQIRKLKIPMKVINDHTDPKVFGEIKIEFFNPRIDLIHKRRFKRGPEINNDSIVCLIYGYGHSILFTGDIEKRAEQEIESIWKKRKLHSISLLKVPHHGSLTSSDTSFLEVLNPQLAVVSAGNLGLHHFPHVQIVKRYEDLGIPLYSTEHCGAIRFLIKGDRSFRLESKKGNCQQSSR